MVKRSTYLGIAAAAGAAAVALADITFGLGLFSTEGFVPRRHCGDWPAWQIVVDLASDVLIALSYFAIPAALWTLWVKRRDVYPQPWTVWAFALFIFSCGLTHLFDALMYWHPVYRLRTLSLAETALVSVPVALCLPGAVRHIMSLPTAEEYGRALVRLELEQARRQRILEEQQRRAAAIAEELDGMRAWAARLEGREQFVVRTDELLRRVRAVQEQLA